MLILLSFLLFPVTYCYLSPALIIMGAHEGVITGSFIVFALMFVTALFLGRGFCGWVCPGAGLQEAMIIARDEPARGGRLNWIKWMIWVPWIAVIALMAASAGGLSSIDFTYNLESGISATNVMSYVIYYIVVGIIVLLHFKTGNRAFCHYGCWMAPFMILGTKTSSLLKLPTLHLAVEPEKCNECRRCNRTCPMSLDVMSMALSGDMSNSECILCGNCVDICKQGAVEFRFGRRKPVAAKYN